MGKSFKNNLSIRADSHKDLLDLTFEEKDNRITDVTSITSSQNEINEVSNKIIRQTFLIDKNHFETLKDFVHTRKTSGEYTYSQKEALHEALELLFKTIDILRRPESIIEKERHRSDVLKSSLKKKNII